MNEPTMTLRELEQTLEAQEGELQAAYRALTEDTGKQPIPLSVEALERLREACSVRPMSSASLKPAAGIRC